MLNLPHAAFTLLGSSNKWWALLFDRDVLHKSARFALAFALSIHPHGDVSSQPSCCLFDSQCWLGSEPPKRHPSAMMVYWHHTNCLTQLLHLFAHQPRCLAFTIIARIINGCKGLSCRQRHHAIAPFPPRSPLVDVLPRGIRWRVSERTAADGARGAEGLEFGCLACSMLRPGEPPIQVNPLHPFTSSRGPTKSPLRCWPTI